MALPASVQTLETKVRIATILRPALDRKKMSGRQMCDECCGDLLRPAKAVVDKPEVVANVHQQSP